MRQEAGGYMEIEYLPQTVLSLLLNLEEEVYFFIFFKKPGFGLK